MDPHGAHHVPERPDRRRAGHDRRGAPRMDGHARLSRGQPVARARRRRGAPRRATDRSGPRARRRLRMGARCGAVCARCAGRLRPDRVPQDQRQARHPRQRADRTAMVLHRGTSRGARARPGGRAPTAGESHHGVVEGRAPRRLPGLQPERAGSDRGERLQRATDARRARLHPVGLGRGRHGRPGRVHAAHRPRPASARSATRGRASTITWACSTVSSISRRATRPAGSGTRRGHRTSPRPRASPHA